MIPTQRSAESQSVAKPAPLYANPLFMQVWVLNIISGLSFSIYLLTESWYVIHQLEQQSWMGIVTMLTVLPRLLFMIIGGTLADRVNKVTLIASSIAIKGLLLIAMGVLASLGHLFIYPLLFFSFFFGVADALSGPAFQAIIPSLLQKEQLLRGNSLIQSVSQSIQIIGPIIGGIIVLSCSYPIIFLTLGSIVILSGFIMSRVRLTTNSIKKEDVASMGAPVSSFAHDMVEGLRYIRSSKILVGLLPITVVTNFFIAGPGSLSIPLIANDVLHGTSLHLSYLESAIGIGFVIGAITIGAVNPKSRRGYIVLGQLLLLGLSFLFLSQVNQLWEAIILFFLIGAVITGGSIPIQTLIQSQTAPEKLGRVMAISSAVSGGLVPLSLAITSIFLSYHISITSILFVCGILVTGYFLLVLFLSRTIRSIN